MNKIIAIDGESYCGKSTISTELSRLLGCIYINTGHMYRAVASKCLEKNINFMKHNSILSIAKSLNMKFKLINNQSKTIVNGKDLSNDATIDLPIIYPRLSTYYNDYVIISGAEYLRQIYERIYYLIDYDMYIMPGSEGRYAFEQQSLLVWQKSSRLNLSFGYKLVVGEYPFGGQAHLLPTINLKFGW